MIYEARAIADEGEEITLDPFAFWPDIRSRLAGFGGPEESENPDYAFHTLYASCGTGPILFTAHFTGLQAARGTLILRVHELPEVMGAHARQIAMSQTQLVDLIRGGGSVSLPATARAGSHYAFLGYIYGDTVATADAVAINVARRCPDPHAPDRPTQFHADAARVAGAPQIIGDREGTMVTPVSQLCTQQQIGEPICGALLEQLGGVAEGTDVDRWEHAFLARALDRYDVARSGARGLGFGAAGDPIEPWLVQHGCSVLVTSPHDQIESERGAGSEAITLKSSRIDRLEGFDFAWATRAGGVGAVDRQAALTFIEDVLRALKPGGLFVLVTAIDVAPRPIGDETGPLFRRPDIVRMALVLLSRGHQVAQISPWGNALGAWSADGVVFESAIGLIVRKAT